MGGLGSRAQPRRWQNLLVSVGLVGVGFLSSALPAVADDALLASRSFSFEQPVGPVTDPTGLTALQLSQLEWWSRDYSAWLAWMDKWRNRLEPGWFSSRERLPKPDPPPWLSAACVESLVDAPPLTEGCALLDSWSDDVASAQIRRQAVEMRTDREKLEKTLWWERIHLDGFWPIMTAHQVSYGVLGTHATMDLAGRLQIFMVPGFMMLNLPSTSGRQWVPATDWGFAYRLGTVRLPTESGRATVHLNIAKAWLLDGAAALVGGSVDLVGLSLTFSHQR